MYLHRYNYITQDISYYYKDMIDLYILINVIPWINFVSIWGEEKHTSGRTGTMIYNWYTPRNFTMDSQKYLIFKEFAKELSFPNHQFPADKIAQGTSARLQGELQEMIAKPPVIKDLTQNPVSLPSSELLCHKK